VLAPWLAAAVYGAWAGFSNWSAPSASAWIIAAIVQGTFAFVSTLLLTKMVVFLLQWKTSTLAWWQVYLLCSAVLLFVPSFLHFIAGTPHIIHSILPGAVIGHVYLGYLIFLSKRADFVEC
jgi:hypothetical protein